MTYIINTRNFDKEIVYEFMKKYKFYENKNGSCVLVGYDNNE
ncbi:DUF3991 domain-containing protein [Clostridium ihumii]